MDYGGRIVRRAVRKLKDASWHEHVPLHASA